MLPNYLKKDGQSVLFNSLGKFVFYIPEFYFESKYAIVNGEYISTLGMLQYEVFNEEGKSVTKQRTFEFPSVFLTKPSNIEKVKNVSLGGKTLDIRVLSYIKGDQIIVSTKVPQLTSNIEAFFKLFNSGKQSRDIPYNEIQNYYLEVAKINGLNYGVTTQLIGVAISELNRDPKDITVPYRLSKEFNNKNYEPLNILEVPKYISPYTAFTSQNFDDALVSSMTNKNETYSPLEKLLTD